jgi:hypothetical protein
MNRFVLPVSAALMTVCLILCCPGGRAAGSHPPASQPARTDGAASKPAEDPKFRTPTPRQVEAAMAKAQEYADKVKTFAPGLRTVETPHFRIYSTFPTSDDKPLTETVEGMYVALCGQFDIPAKDNIWVGKCTLFLLAKDEDYVKFTKEVDKANLVSAGGYCSHYSMGMVYVIMRPCSTRTRFYEVLVHEHTHGFLARYLSDKEIPSWLNEGLADLMAAKLVPGCYAQKLVVNSTKTVIKEKKDISYIFEKVKESFDYGVAQSLVQFLIARDRAGFIKLITEIKQGVEEEQALKDVYKLSHTELLKAWFAAASASVR